MKERQWMTVAETQYDIQTKFQQPQESGVVPGSVLG